uniref:Si:dkey-237j11.3 n=1 Tax=Oryzias sinensis TaxID=183150 RepID=A0A8C7YNH1_9TELE
MAARTVCLFLLIAVCLGQQTPSHNSAPCQRSNNNNGYNRFLRHHIPPNSPATRDRIVWERFIWRRRLCHRPIQSFLHPDDKNRVKAVCTARGGKVYWRNLCISRRRFTFYTVRYRLGTCRVQHVKREEKHLILACDKLDNRCLPVHFERNRDNETPDNNARGCGAPQHWAG